MIPLSWVIRRLSLIFVRIVNKVCGPILQSKTCYFQTDEWISNDTLMTHHIPQVFTADSPGRTGVWIGWQIVQAYMNTNPGTSLKELMENDDYLGILNNSGYQPD